MVGSNEDCKKKETPLDWNIQGQPGPQGPIGNPGVLGFYTRSTLAAPVPTDSIVSLSRFATLVTWSPGAGLNRVWSPETEASL